jgi:MFS family permease
MFPIGGYLADNTRRVRLIVLANSLTVVVVLIYSFSPNWQIFAFATLLQGFLVFQFPARSALIADSLSPNDRGRGIAAMNSVSSIFAVAAPFLAGTVITLLGDKQGISLLYLGMALLYAISAYIMYRYLVEPPAKSLPDASISLSHIPQVLRDTYAGIPSMLRALSPSLKALAGVIVFSFMANGVASPFWVVYATDEIGLTSAAWGLILLIETVLRLMMFIPAGMVVDRWGRTRALLVSLVVSLAAIPAFVFVQGFATALLVRCVIAVSFALAIPSCTALLADTVPREMRGRVMSALGQGGIMIGPAGGGTGGPAVGYLVIVPLILSFMLGGILYTINPVLPWVFVTVTTLLSILLVVLFIRDPQEAEV